MGYVTIVWYIVSDCETFSWEFSLSMRFRNLDSSELGWQLFMDLIVQDEGQGCRMNLLGLSCDLLGVVRG